MTNPDSESVTLVRLTRRLSVAAESEGLLDVAVRTVDSPIGPLLLAATAEGLVKVDFASLGYDEQLQWLATHLSPRILEAPKRLDEAAQQLDEYFAKKRLTFAVSLDLRLARGFRRDVLTQLRSIPYGRTASYGEVATGVGNPRAVRAVGTACALNPLPLIIPCHRVVRSDGTEGSYAGGVAAKHYLLQLEAA